MWSFAADHPVWFFVYLGTCCLTTTLVSQAIAWAIKAAAEARSSTVVFLDSDGKVVDVGELHRGDDG